MFDGRLLAGRSLLPEASISYTNPVSQEARALITILKIALYEIGLTLRYSTYGGSG